MKILKSILRDIKSLDMIILNRWHFHAPIAFIIGFIDDCLSNNRLEIKVYN